MPDNDFDGSKERLRRDGTHRTTPFADDAHRDTRPISGDRPADGTQRTAAGGRPVDTPAPHTAGEPTDPDITSEPDDADTIKHRPEDGGYGSGNNALGRTRGEVKNISPDDQAEAQQNHHEAQMARKKAEANS